MARGAKRSFDMCIFSDIFITFFMGQSCQITYSRRSATESRTDSSPHPISFRLASSHGNWTRENRLDAGETAEEFFKLALECDLALHESRSIRDSVKRRDENACTSCKHSVTKTITSRFIEGFKCGMTFRFHLRQFPRGWNKPRAKPNSLFSWSMNYLNGRFGLFVTTGGLEISDGISW